MSKGEPKNLCDHVKLSVEKYFQDLSGQETTGVYQMVLSEIEKPLLEVVMHYSDNNQSKASKVLGINRNTLRKKLETHGLID